MKASVFRYLDTASLFQKNNYVPRKLGYVLEHCYSQATLSPEKLKARDRNIYEILSSSPLFKIKTIKVYVNFCGRIKKGIFMFFWSFIALRSI